MKKRFLFSAVFLVSALLQIMLTDAAISSTFPIATTANREMSISATFDGTNYLVGIQGDAVDKHNIAAQRVSRSGTLIGSRISVGRTGGAPLVAFDGVNYLMVWEDDDNSPNNDVYGQFISKTGTLVGSPFPISKAAGKQAVNSIAFDGTNYLVVWEDSRNWNDIDDDGECDPSGEGTCVDIYGRFVSPSGNLVGNELSINKAVANQKVPFLSFDGTNYLVVWESRRSGPELWDIKGRFISKTGTLSSTFTISQTPSPRYNPVYTAFDGTNYFVVWNRDIGGGYPDPTIWDVYGRMVSPSGSFPGSEFAITTATGSQWIAGPVFDGNRYLVFWTDTRNDTNNDWDCDAGEGTCWDIYGQYVAKTGTLIGSEFAINKDAGNQFGVVIFGGGKYLVLANYFDSWEGSVGDVYGMFFCTTLVKPVLNRPANGATGVPTTPLLDWGNVSGAASYDVQICSNNTCSTVVRSKNVTSSQWTVSPALNQGTVYYWRVRSRNACGASLWSSIRSFTTCSNPSPPSLVSPANGATGVSTTPLLDWGNVSGAASYDVRVCADNTCSTVVRSKNVTSSQWTIPVSSALNQGTVYYWRVRSRNACGASSWSSIRKFTTSGP